MTWLEFFSRLLSVVSRTPRWKTFAAGGALVLAAATPLFTPYLLKLFVDIAIPRRDLNLLWSLGVAAVVVYAVASLTRHYGRMEVARLAEDFRRRLTCQAFSHLQGLSLSYHRSRGIGDLSARILYDTYSLKSFIASTLPAAVELAVTIGGTAIILVILAPSLTLLAFAALPAALIIAYLFRDKIRPLSRELSEHHGKVYATVHEALTSIEESKVYGGAAEFDQRLAEQSRRLADTEVEIARHRNKLLPLLNFGISLVLVGVLVGGGYMIIAGTVSVGTVVAYYFYISKSLGPIRSASTLMLSWHRAVTAMERLQELFDSEERLEQTGNPRELSEIQWDIAFENVSFRYSDSQTNRSFVALENLTFNISHGQRIALLGPSGAGKSTTGKMVPRLFDPDHGQITVGGVSLKDLALDEWRQRVGYVGQNVFLFSGSIEQNIRFGLKTTSAEDAFKLAIRAARVDEVIAQKPDGLATQVGERGTCLSGGQKKRIALARALLRSPAVLVIDQLAADLQEDLCREIFEMIRREYHVSILYLGHRVPAGFNPDAVYWMEEGRIKRQLQSHEGSSARCEVDSSIGETGS
ncbi:ABC transporter ATP-binding protein [Persicimonas caeni]|uniref:ABC transporter ATP-binding protein n=1 Tax=Persicimonas caeni TaxID=2292766 RepID=A0A4Y6PX84_PERCE|nr:ABC transporter ATP-binding protein [Persicimonas caeni]QDG52627.1 ABC transporter ATP-binding protein [Persicimonas caeni]QED33849.1 ABC transporter ATP-binding protein [Persicimonas caeni]